MAAKFHVSDVRAYARKALDHGAVAERPWRVRWDVSGRCSAPIPVTLAGRPDGRMRIDWKHPASMRGPAFFHTRIYREKSVTFDGVSTAPMWLDIEAPCRKCEHCLKVRRMTWANRATAEIRQSARTWFGTLTLSPASHYIMRCRASHRLRNSAVNIDTLPTREVFAELVRESGKEVTLFLKRVRAASQVPLRYLVVAEPHKSNLPHWHLLIHEPLSGQCVRKALLEEEWRLGFSHWRLVQEEKQQNAAWYVAKYLTKGDGARVRASVSYGKDFTVSDDSDSVKNKTQEKTSSAWLEEVERLLTDANELSRSA